MDVLQFEPELQPEWDGFVESHPLAGYGHLSANFALASQTAGVQNASLLVREGRKIIAVLPLFERAGRALRAIPVRELTSGAFFPAGPLISIHTQGKAEATALAALLDAINERGRHRRIDRITIAYPNISGGQPTITRLGYSPLLHHGYHARPGVGLLLDLTQSVEQLGAGRNAGCRQRINKAQAAGMTTSVITDRSAWLSCHALNLQTLGALALTEAEVAAIWDNFIVPGHATAHGVYLDGAMTAVTVTIHSNGAAYYWHGWRPANAPNGASHLSLWTAILASRERGARFFELGSLEFVNAKNIGISQFKQSFGGVPFQTVSAQRELKPVKAAAISLAETATAAYRRRQVASPNTARASAPMGAPISAPVPSAVAVAKQ